MLKVVFMGTPEFSVPTLNEILGAGHDVVAVYTQPPRPAGRGMGVKPSPVHAFAEAAGLEVRHPTSLNDDDAAGAFEALEADVAVVIAYGLILPQRILDAPRHGCLNMHASQLPRWRGAAPIQRAIMAGDEETAAMVMRMEAGLDTGPICLGERVAIGPDMTAGELHDRLSRVGADLMVRALAALERGSLEEIAQPKEGVTYAQKIDKAESAIDFTKPAADVHNHIRGLSPFPGAWFELKQVGRPERIKVLRSSVIATAGDYGAAGTFIDACMGIACGEGAVRCIELQRAGRKPMRLADFLHGMAIGEGSRAVIHQQSG